MIVACFLSPFLPNTPQRTGVKLSDGPRAITQEQLVCRVLESVERLPAGKDFTAKGIHLSAARRMGNHNGIGHVGNEAVSSHRGLGRDVAYLFRKRRDHYEAAIIDGRLERGGTFRERDTR